MSLPKAPQGFEPACDKGYDVLEMEAVFFNSFESSLAQGLGEIQEDSTNLQPLWSGPSGSLTCLSYKTQKAQYRDAGNKIMFHCLEDCHEKVLGLVLSAVNNKTL